MASPSRSRRDVLRALSVGALALPVTGCGTLLGRRDPLPPVTISPPPPLDSLATQRAEVMAVPRAGALPHIEPARTIVRPPRLAMGGTIGLVAPAGVLRSAGQVRDAVRAFTGLGFRTVVGDHVLDREGFLAGTDAARAADLMDMICNPDVDAIVALRGGWGAARILPLLDYGAIAEHPKPIVGFSDITALLLAIHAKTGIVTFHGPVGTSAFTGLTASSFVQTLVDGVPPRLGPETRTNRSQDRTEAVVQGVAEGPVLGGNLTVIAALAGTDYLPDFDGAVVFFEEVREDAYRVDRMLSQLALAGILRNPAAIAFGQCSSCSSGGSAWSAEETIRRFLAGFACPSVLGAAIGHYAPVQTLPIGLPARLDAGAGTLTYLDAAVA